MAIFQDYLQVGKFKLSLTIIFRTIIDGNIIGLPASWEIEITTDNYFLWLSSKIIFQEYQQLEKSRLSLIIICGYH